MLHPGHHKEAQRCGGARPRKAQLYLDNGPVVKSAVFQRVMDCLGVIVTAHMPARTDRTRTTARAKGKVERPFRTVKEAHETLYHHHMPETEAEANAWLCRFVDRENERDHRHEPHSRVDDWLANQPPDGIRAMCSWERFCSFAREPERRKVGVDARVSVAGATYELDPELAGETVVLWWGLFDQELFAELGDDRYGPVDPVGGAFRLTKFAPKWPLNLAPGRPSLQSVTSRWIDAVGTGDMPEPAPLDMAERQIRR